MRVALALSAVVGLCVVSDARAVIEVASNLANVDSPTAFRTQGVITEPAGLGGGSITTAVAIKEIQALVRIRDGQINNGLLVRKRQLTAFETYGAGHPLGYLKPPITDPSGPWFGLVWPFRDQYDYFPGDGDPLGDDVGIFFQDGSLYGYRDIEGIVRGGPTDPEPAGGSIDRLRRGITGNGLDGPASYFQFEVIPIFGDPNRAITIDIVSASAVVVQRNNQTGAFSEITVQIPDYTTTVRLPEPGVAMVGAMMSLVALRRRRR